MRGFHRAIVAPLMALTGTLLPRVAAAAYPLYGSPGVARAPRSPLMVMVGRRAFVLLAVIGIAAAILFGAFLVSFLLELFLRRYRPDARDARSTGAVAKRLALYWVVASAIAAPILASAFFLAGVF